MTNHIPTPDAMPYCASCGNLSDDYVTARLAYSTAEWHNTNTSHEVSVDVDMGEDTYLLTDEGWI